MAPKHFAPVWQHYERREPTGRSKHHRAICRFCAYELSGQPERMKTHLQRCPECPQHIKDEFAVDEQTNSSNTGGAPAATTYGSGNGYGVSRTGLFERDEDGVGRAEQPPQKRRRSVERIVSGAEGLAGLPWAPNENVGAIAPARKYPEATHEYPEPMRKHHRDDLLMARVDSVAPAVPPGFQQTYTAPAAPVPAAVVPPPGGGYEPSFQGVYENVRGYYSRLTPMNKMQTSIGPTVLPHPLIRDAIARVPKAVRERFYGCGVPLPAGIDGLRVLDLGCGAGRDCYVAARLVGPAGEVIGVDMTDEQLRVARECVPEYARALGYQPHLRFTKGYIEFLSQLPELYPGSIDLCISNNAVNLSPNKELVLRSVFEILKEGGEFQFSDIYADRRLPNHVRSHPVLMGECLGGALYTEDFRRLCQRVGFVDARQVNPPAPVRIEAPELRDLVGATQFYSITFRLFKFARPSSVLEPTREDYGQVASYRGTIDGQRARIRFDNQWSFEANRPVLVDGNTAVMLAESWLRRHFEVRGDRSQHFGCFAAAPPPVHYEPWETDHDLDEGDADGAGGRRRGGGILPLPTPYFLTGLRPQPQKPDAHSASSHGASPTLERPPRSPPPLHSLPGPRMSRDHPTAFPRLSSFSISQSNVRADGGNAAMRYGISTAPASIGAGRSGATLPPPESPSDSRFMVPASRVQPLNPVSPGLVPPPRFAPVTTSGSSPSLRSGSTASPVGSAPPSQAPPRLQFCPQPSHTSAPPTAAQPRLSPSPPPPDRRQHGQAGPQSPPVAATPL
ncbi:hypothetical protein GGF46_003355 [Coemansia sp. RSA 552]|nr:hypothetical protein GGF46_003355 [Coemansia sp. RSA 552]